MNINVGIHYLGAWLAGNGCVPIHNLMEDAATAEISRSQVWQWIRSPKGVLDDGRKVTAELVRALVPEELAKIKAGGFRRQVRSRRRDLHADEHAGRLRRVPHPAAVRGDLGPCADALLALALAAAAAAAGCALGLGRPGTGIDRAAADPSVRPQDDFFRRVNGRWLATTPFPADKAYLGSFDTIHDKIQEQLRGLVEKAAISRVNADERRIGDLYAQLHGRGGRRARRPRAAGRRAGGDRRVAVARPAGRRRWAACRGSASPCRCTPTSTRTRATPGATCRRSCKAGSACPTATTTWSTTTPSSATRARATPPTWRACSSCRATRGDAGRRALGARARDRARARPVDARRDPRPGQGLQRASRSPPSRRSLPGFDWPAWLDATGLAGKAGDVIVQQPSYLGAVAAQLSADVRCRPGRRTCEPDCSRRTRPYLGKAFVDARFAFVGATLSGTTENQPRWKRGVVIRRGVGGRIAGQALRRRVLPAELEGADGKAGRQPARRVSREHRHARLDEPGDQAARRRPSWRPSRRRSAIRSAGSTTARSTIRKDDLLGNVRRAREFEYGARPRQARQAGRSRRVAA